MEIVQSRTTRTRREATADYGLMAAAWVLFLAALMLILASPSLFAQGPGAIKTQEIYSSTGTVKIDGTLNLPTPLPISSGGTGISTGPLAGSVLAGPTVSPGSSVGVRQYVHCEYDTPVNADSPKSFSCPQFANPIIVGDSLLVISPQLGSRTGSSSFTDSLGNTITNHVVTTTGSPSPTVAYGTITVGGADSVSGSNIAYWANGGSHSQYDFWVFELTNASGVNLASSFTAPNSSPATIALTPSATTDSFIRLALIGSNTISTPAAGTAYISPAGSDLFSVSAADVKMGFGKSDTIAPDTTASFSSQFSWSLTAGPSPTQVDMVVDITQSASVGAGPWVARKLTVGDLPLPFPLTDEGGQVFNVKAYGAKGDGVTNDSSAFQAAFNAAQPAGGLVWIPGCGPYYVPTVPTNISTVSFDSPGYTCANKFVMQPPFDSNDIYYNYNTITSTDNLSGTNHSVEGWVFDINQTPNLPTMRNLAVGADLSVLTATGTPPTNNSPTLTGNFDGMFAAVQSGGAAWNSVGVMGIGDCITSSGNCWGANFIAGDSASLASQPPNEYALELNNTPSNAASLYSSADAFNALRISLLNTHMPTGGAGAIGNAINIVSNGTSGYGWNTAFSSGDGASLNGIYLGLAYGTAPVASQNITLKSSGGTGSMLLDSGGAWIVNMPSSDVKFAHTGTDLSLDLQNNSGTTWHLDSLSSKDLSIFSDAGTGKVTLNGWNFAASGSPGISAGTISISASTSGSYTFTTAYTTAPICTATETSGTVISPTISSTTTNVTVTVGTSGTYGFNFICVPAAN